MGLYAQKTENGGQKQSAPLVRLAWQALLAMALAFAPAAAAAVAEPAAVRVMTPAAEAFEQGMGAWGVRLADSGGAVLHDRLLVEDDGPGVGSDAAWLEKDRSPVEQVSGQVRVKKVLVVERPEALGAFLCVPAGMVVEVNGQALGLASQGRDPEVPVALLRKGANEIVLSCAEGASQTVKIAAREDILRNAPERAGRPPRSFKSADGGKTWEPVDGEYMVRLHLIQYAAEGNFISPVLDLGGGTADGTALLSPVSVRSVTVSPEAETPEGTRVTLAIRTGPCPVYDAALWTDWRGQDDPVTPGHRYLQWKATLASADPLKTPVLKAVAVEARVVKEPWPAWASKVKVADAHNGRMPYTSIPYTYEDFLHPRLVALREKYKLDEVVSGSATEFEKLVKLRNWVAQQWKYKPPEQAYPAWDADEILTLKYGFCVQYAVVYMQCCLSLGYPTRFVFGYHPGVMGGHEVCEVWSNQYDKWVLMDPNVNHHYVDPPTNVPLSMMEVHDRMVEDYYGQKDIAPENRPSAPRGSDRIGTCQRLEMEPAQPQPSAATPLRNWPRWAKWAVVRMVPRDDFYARPYPVPKTQGAQWDWTGYWIWEDAQTPRSYDYRYAHITARRSDWEWTINQVRFDAACGTEPGAVQVQMGTVTPGFRAFLVSTDGSTWQEQAAGFAWRLHPGRNRLDMRVVNTAGVQGPASFIVLDYDSAGK